MTDQEQKILSQREEIRRLQNKIHALRQSRDFWQEKAIRVGKQLHEVLTEKGEAEQ